METKPRLIIWIFEDDEHDIYQFKRDFKDCIIVIFNPDEKEVNDCLSVAPAPDVIIVDVMLTRISGFSVLKCIKTRCDLNNIPVILTSGCAVDLVGEWAKYQGRNDSFFVKPITPAKVEAVLGAYNE